MIVGKTIIKTRYLFAVLCLLLCTFPAVSKSQESIIKGLRLWAGPDSTRLVLDVSAPLEHKVFVLHNPLRVVIDLKNARFGSNVLTPKVTGSMVKAIRSARHDDELRVVLDLKSTTKPKSFLLKPNKSYGHRLVLDLDITTKRAVKAYKPIKTVEPSKKPRPLIVAIDAGHGGDDPGAIGKKGTREKDVVLSISRKLHRMLRKEPGIKPIMIRKADYYVSLRNRIKNARHARADLFISIHADAIENGHAEGASVYVLSDKGASSEAARWLAVSQNDSDLIGGVSLDDKDELLASVLLDLSQNATIAASTAVGETMLSQLKRVAKLHKDEVENAGFVVLKSPDIPSILVETGFISNPREESKLRDRRYQDKVARALVKGVKRFFQASPVPGTIFARKKLPVKTRLAAKSSRTHEIKKGETLTAIARRYKVDRHRLMRVNRLSSDMIIPGQVLQIPL